MTSESGKNDHSDTAPLMLVVAHISFSHSPEILQRITDVKAGLAELELPIADQRQQRNYAINPVGGSPQITDRTFWWFTSPDRRRAVAVADNSLVVYDSAYGRFDQFKSRLQRIGKLIEQAAGSGCFLTALAIRYVSGFQTKDVPSRYIHPGLYGLPIDRLDTEHFHHQYSFWCVTSNGGHLVANVKTVHGNQLIPQDVLSAQIAIDEKFVLDKELNAVQLDIHETIKKKPMVQLSVPTIEQSMAIMRHNVKSVFLTATTEEAHRSWGIA